MNRYETVFILTPVLSETQVEEAVQKFVGFLKEKGANIVSQEDWGLKKLAYPIQNKRNGFYHLVEFETSPDAIAGFEVEFKRDERVIRFLTLKLDKHGVAWSEERRKKLKTTKQN